MATLFPWPSFSSPSGLFTHASTTLTGGLFGFLMPLLPLVAIQSSMMSRGYRFSRSLPVSTFLSMITASILRAIRLVSNEVVFGYTVLFLIAAVLARMET